eukprot:TRINITY_DN6176_c0_g1_i4.p1 TRINITY_DN6176_c0_g1~~TRINITY_DN6176_c0_g1_i4.p1  ORF type:complete len:2565 (+),score=356.55 TRINITY_DN6176_c0_g1_i4:83-7777(+)
MRRACLTAVPMVLLCCGRHAAAPCCPGGQRIDGPCGLCPGALTADNCPADYLNNVATGLGCGFLSAGCHRICECTNVCPPPPPPPSPPPPFPPPPPPPTSSPTEVPSRKPSAPPTTSAPTQSPTWVPTSGPTAAPTQAPTTQQPSIAPSSASPTTAPTVAPSPVPSVSPTYNPSVAPSVSPSAAPTTAPTWSPSTSPTSNAPTTSPTEGPSESPTKNPTSPPSAAPTSAKPTAAPSPIPTVSPSSSPTVPPSSAPTAAPSTSPPSASPTVSPTWSPTLPPTRNPTWSAPTKHPTTPPTISPTYGPTETPCPCGLHGECERPNCCPWVCTCHDDPKLGHWGGSLCDNCAHGWWGPDCLFQCPGGACSPCSMHGDCSQGTAGSGHCSCFEDPVHGHWRGHACRLCIDGWAGPRCTIRCQDCHGHGNCHPATGECQCLYGYDRQSNCALRLCGGGIAGPDECSGHGKCVGGECSCQHLYWNSSCGQRCNCTGFSCHQQTGACNCGPNFALPHCADCVRGHWGQGCTKPCKCNGRGRCRRLDGACECDAGWAGVDCSTPCPSGVPPCSGHGRCAADAMCRCPDGQCQCDAGWQGPQCGCPCWQGSCDASGTCTCSDRWQHGPGGPCSTCSTGWAGDQCASPCIHGASVGTQCECQREYAGVSCNTTCPSGSGGLCGGPSRGECGPVHADPGAERAVACSCRPGLYGAACAVECDPDTSCPHMLHAQCSTEGACECQSNRDGYWQGEHCDQCVPLFWGADCALPCECSGHGYCDRSSGLCDCFRSEDTGHWAGKRCDICFKGYRGELCNVPAVPVCRVFPSRNSSAHVVFGGGAPSFVVVAADGGSAFAGFNRTGVVVYSLSQGLPELSIEVSLGGAHPVGGWWVAAVLWVVANGALGPALWMVSYTGAARQVRKLATDAPVVAACRLSPTEVLVVREGCSDSAFFDTAGAERPAQLAPHAGPAASPGACGRAACGAAAAVACGTTASPAPAQPGLQPAVVFSCVLQRSGAAPEPLSVQLTGGGGLLAVALTDGDETLLMMLNSSAGVSLRIVHTVNGTEAALPLTVSGRPPQPGSPAVLIADPASSAAFAFLQEAPGVPSAVFWISLGDHPGVVGTVHMGAPRNIPEVVSAAGLTPGAVCAASSSSSDLIVIAAHSVTRAEPDIADSRGGTEVAVLGSGFILPAAAAAVCRFREGDERVNASYDSPQRLVCTAPPVERPLCGGRPVEVALSLGGHFCESAAILERIRAPQLSATRGSGVGDAAAPRQLAILGSGLVKSRAATCVFYVAHQGGRPRPRLYHRRRAPPGEVFLECSGQPPAGNCTVPPGAHTAHVPATVTPRGEVLCAQPSSEGRQLGWDAVDVAVDGQIYTGSPVYFPVIDRAAGLLAPKEYVATPEHMSGIEVLVVDAADHALRERDTARRNISITVVAAGVNASELPDMRLTAVGGSAYLPPVRNFTGSQDSIFLLLLPSLREARRRRRGSIVFTEVTEGWKAVTAIVIRPGLPRRLRIEQEPHPTAADRVPLQVQPVVAAVDLWDNVVDTLYGPKVHASTVSVPRVISVDTTVPFSRFQGGTASFADLTIYHPRFGVEYRLHFTSPPLESALSDVVIAEPCESEEQYQPPGDYACRDCPRFGECFGNTTVVPVADYWQPIQDIPLFYHCVMHDVCRGAAPGDAGCTEGTGGPFCQACAPGYARARGSRRPCEACQNAAAAGGVIAALMLCVGCAVVVCACFCVYRWGALGKRMVVLRVLIIFLQVLSKFDEYLSPLPDPLGSSVFFIARLVSVDVTLYQPFNCFDNVKMVVVYMYIAWPFAASVAGIATVAVLRARGADAHEGMTVGTVCCIAFSAAYIIGFATVLTHFIALQHCDSFGADANGVTLEALNSRVIDQEWKYVWPEASTTFQWIDTATLCSGEHFQGMLPVMLSATLVFAVAVPVLYVALYPRVLRGRFDGALQYVIGGFRRERWWWPLVVAAREVAVIWPSVVATEFVDHRKQHYLAMWSLAAACIAQHCGTPYNTRLLNRLELGSLMYTTVLMSLSLLFWNNDVRGTWVEQLVVHLLNLALYGVVGVFIYHLLPAGLQESVLKPCRDLDNRLHRRRRVSEVRDLLGGFDGDLACGGDMDADPTVGGTTGTLSWVSLLGDVSGTARRPRQRSAGGEWSAGDTLMATPLLPVPISAAPAPTAGMALPATVASRMSSDSGESGGSSGPARSRQGRPGGLSWIGVLSDLGGGHSSPTEAPVGDPFRGSSGEIALEGEDGPGLSPTMRSARIERPQRSWRGLLAELAGRPSSPPEADGAEEALAADAEALLEARSSQVAASSPPPRSEPPPERSSTLGRWARTMPSRRTPSTGTGAERGIGALLGGRRARQSTGELEGHAPAVPTASAAGGLRRPRQPTVFVPLESAGGGEPARRPREASVLLPGNPVGSATAPEGPRRPREASVWLPGSPGGAGAVPDGGRRARLASLQLPASPAGPPGQEGSRSPRFESRKASLYSPASPAGWGAPNSDRPRADTILASTRSVGGLVRRSSAARAPVSPARKRAQRPPPQRFLAKKDSSGGAPPHIEI